MIEANILRHSEQKGITIITDANTSELIGQDGHITQVQLKDGTILDADLVVLLLVFLNITLAQSANCVTIVA